MLPGTLSGGDVQQFVTRVLVNGIARDVLSVSLDRELVSDLPDQVVSGTGVRQATGKVEWASADVESGGLSPWNPSLGWIPNDGDRVEIYVSDGFTEWSRGKMRIDESEGAIGGGMASTLVDAVDDFSATVDIPALMAHMPPLLDGGPWRRVGLSTLYHTNEALRAAGFFTTPKPEFGVVVDATMQGSMWPTTGTVTLCQRQSDNLLSPPSYAASWGSAHDDLSARYTPSVSRPAASSLQMTIMVAEDHAGLTTFDAMYGTSRVRVRIDANRAVQTYLGNTLVASLTSAQTAGATIVTLLVKGSTWTIRTNTGAQGAGTQSMSGVTGTLTEVVLAAAIGARIAAVQVSHPTTPAHEFVSLAFEATARILVGGLGVGNGALPSVGGQSAAEVLDTIGNAKLQPMWIDETGKAQVIASDVLRGQGTHRALTTLDDVLEMSWKKSLLSTRSKVVAKYQEPSITARLNASVEVWSSSGSDVLASAEVREDVITPPSDEDWILVDETLEIPGVHALGNINKGVGSVAGGVYTNGADESWAAAPAVGKLAISMVRTNANEWRIKHTAAALAGGYQVELRTFSDQFVGTTGLWPYWWGRELPIIRAKARIQWMDRERTPSVAGTIGPELQLDFGPWATGFQGSETVAVDAISSFIAEQVIKPQPTVEGLRIVPDPRLQLGDVVSVSSTRLLGVTLRCLVARVSESFTSEGYAQALDLRVIEATLNRVTYDQFAKAWPNNADYTSFAAAWEAVSNYQDFNTDPLKGTP